MMLQHLTTANCQHITHNKNAASSLPPVHMCSADQHMLVASNCCDAPKQQLLFCFSALPVRSILHHYTLTHCSADLWLHVNSCPELGMVTSPGLMVALTLHARRTCQSWALRTCAMAASEACLSSWAGQTHSGRTARQKDSLGVSRMC